MSPGTFLSFALTSVTLPDLFSTPSPQNPPLFLFELVQAPMLLERGEGCV